MQNYSTAVQIWFLSEEEIRVVICGGYEGDFWGFGKILDLDLSKGSSDVLLW